MSTHPGHTLRITTHYCASDDRYAQLVPASTILKQDRLWYATDNSGIQQKFENCYNNDPNNKLICWDAGLAASQNFYNALIGSYNPYHVNSNKTDLSTATYLSDPAVASKIGATASAYTEDNIYVAYNFQESGSWSRNSRPLLEGLINKNILVGMWSGDAVRHTVLMLSLARAHHGFIEYRTSSAIT